MAELSSVIPSILLPQCHPRNYSLATAGLRTASAKCQMTVSFPFLEERFSSGAVAVAFASAAAFDSMRHFWTWKTSQKPCIRFQGTHRCHPLRPQANSLHRSPVAFFDHQEGIAARRRKERILDRSPCRTDNCLVNFMQMDQTAVGKHSVAVRLVLTVSGRRVAVIGIVLECWSLFPLVGTAHRV